VAEEVDEEIRFHLETRTAELERLGATPEEARARALEEFGDPRAAREELEAIDRPMARSRDRLQWLAELNADLRHAARRLARDRSYATISVATLALGLAVNLTIASLVHSTLLRPLPYRDADRLFHLWETKAGAAADRSEASYPDFLDLRAGTRGAFEGLEGYDPRNLTVSLRGEASRLRATAVTSGLLPLLGARLQAGRHFTDDEDHPGGAPVAIASASFAARLGAVDPLGETIVLDGRAVTIVGVVAPGFSFALGGDPDLWIPLDASATRRSLRFNHWLRPIGRLADGVNRSEAEALTRTAMATLAREHPDTHAGRSAVLVPLREEIVGRARPIVLALFAAVGLVLLVACANLASLAVTRGMARRRELAVRLALGASRGRIERLVLAESFLIAIAAGTVALALVGPGVRALLDTLPGGLLANHPYLLHAGLDPAMVGYVVLLTIAAGLAMGMGPALAGARAGLDGLSHGGRQAGARGSAALRRALVVGQVALTVALLAGGALLARSLAALLDQELGFRTDGVLTARLALSGDRYQTDAERARYWERALGAARALPGVTAVGAVSNLPLRGGGTMALAVDGEPEPPAAERPEALARTVDGDYFGVMGIGIVAGRAPDQRDGPGAPAAVVVSRGLAERLLAERPIVGRRLHLQARPDVTVLVIGVVEDVKSAALDAAPAPTIYFPGAQLPDGRMTVVARTTGAAAALAPAFDRALRGIDPGVPPYDVATIEDHLAGTEAVLIRRLPLALLGSLGALALLLAAIGVYGVTAYLVVERRREVGVRLALGASGRRVVLGVVGESARLALAGIGLGLALALALGSVFRALLFGVRPADPLTAIAIGLFVLAVTAAASWLPARRAGRVDPAIALSAD